MLLNKQMLNHTSAQLELIAIKSGVRATAVSSFFEVFEVI